MELIKNVPITSDNSLPRSLRKKDSTVPSKNHSLVGLLRENNVMADRKCICFQVAKGSMG
jgi:hypothetical protein